MHKFTFILPAYKPQYLGLSINSILEQTYTDFEILVSDDNSPYSIKNIVDSYDDKRIRYRKNSTNIGGENLVQHWNALLKDCQSEFVIVASDDDVYSNLFLEKIHVLTLEYPNANLFRARTQRINSSGEIIAQDDLFEEYQSKIDVLYSIFCKNFISCVGNYVFRTDSLKNLNGFVPFPYAWFSDLFTALCVVANGMISTRDILFSFRLSSDNISSLNKDKYITKQKLDATIKFDRLLGEYIKKTNYPDNLLYKNNMQRILHSYKHLVYSQCGDYSWAIPLFKWFSIYKNLKMNIYFSRASFFKYYTISIFNRWFSKHYIFDNII